MTAENFTNNLTHLLKSLNHNVVHDYRACHKTCIVCVLTVVCILRLKCDGTRVETRFLLSAKRASPFKSAGASVQSTTGSRGVRISSSNAGYTMFRGSVKSTSYSLQSPVSPSLPLPCVTVCHQISTGIYDTLTCLTVSCSVTAHSS
jgi:hypothetical protein